MAPTQSFELVGDADALPDEFFDAFAGLLLSIEEQDDLEPQAEQGHEQPDRLIPVPLVTETPMKPRTCA